MEKICYILEEDEEILWEHIDITNLMKFLTVFDSVLVLTTILFPIFCIILNILTGMDVITYLIFGELVLIVGTFLSIIKSRFTESFPLQMPLKELKEYKEIYVVTNKRLIQKNYNEAIRTERIIAKHQINCVNIISSDLIIINLNDIEEVIFDMYHKFIYFVGSEYQFYVFRIKFYKQNLSEMQKVKEILLNLIQLEKVEEIKEHIIKYKRVDNKN